MFRSALTLLVHWSEEARQAIRRGGPGGASRASNAVHLEQSRIAVHTYVHTRYILSGLGPAAAVYRWRLPLHF